MTPRINFFAGNQQKSARPGYDAITNHGEPRDCDGEDVERRRTRTVNRNGFTASSLSVCFQIGVDGGVIHPSPEARFFVEVVGVTDRVKVGWRVPSDEWDAFNDYVHAEHGEITGHVGREVERAMRERVDADDFASVEALVDRLVRAAGRRPEDLGEKNISSNPQTGDDTTSVQCRVDADVKERFAHHAKAETDDRVGTVLARALRERRDGGRASRVQRKLERVVDDAESLLADQADGDGASGPVERRTRTICLLLTEDRDGFTREDFAQALDSPKVEGVDESEYRRQKYLPKVLDRLNYLPHPANPDLFIPESQSRDHGADPKGPAIDLWAPEDLADDELVRGLRIELVREAASGTGRGRAEFTKGQVEADVFEGRLSTQKVSSLMASVAGADGFRTKSDGSKRIICFLRDISDDDLLEYARDDDGMDTPSNGRDRQGGQQDREDADESDATPGVQPEDTDEPADVDAEMDALMNATPVTDRGPEG